MEFADVVMSRRMTRTRAVFSSCPVAWASVSMWGLFAIDEEEEKAEMQPFGYNRSS